MRPVLLYLPAVGEYGPFPIFTYGVFVLLGFLAAMVITHYRAKTRGIPTDAIWDLGLYAVICGVVGARLAYLLVDYKPDLGSDTPILDLVAIWKGGLTFQGGLLLALAVTAWYMVSHKLPVGKVMDAFAPGVLVGVGVARIGCFMNSCCWGSIVRQGFPLGVTFPPGSFPQQAQEALHTDPGGHWMERVQALGYGVEAVPPLPVHPAQLYSTVCLVLLALLVVALERTWSKDRPDGIVMAGTLLLYSAFRLVIEFWREDTPLLGAVGDFFPGLRLGQWLSLLTMAVAAVFLERMYRQRHIAQRRERELAAAEAILRHKQSDPPAETVVDVEAEMDAPAEPPPRHDRNDPW